MNTFTTINLIFVIFIALASFGLYLDRENLNFILKVWKKLSIKMFFQCLAFTVFAMAIGVVLSHSVPGLQYNWMHLLSENGSVDLNTTPIVESIPPYPVPILSITAFVLLLIATPLIAREMGKIFRENRITSIDIWKQSVLFGLAHFLIGASLGFTASFTLIGLFFAYQYKTTYIKYHEERGSAEANDEALLVSSSYYSMYIYILLISLILILTL